MRKIITKTQVKYLSDAITHHLEDGCDDRGRWIQALKFVYGTLVTLDNMGVHDWDYQPDIITMDTMFEQLRNEFAKESIWMPLATVYYK